MQNTEVAFLHVAAAELLKGCRLDLVLYVVKLSKEVIISIFFPWLKKNHLLTTIKHHDAKNVTKLI
jgi:hypothetical protein